MASTLISTKLHIPVPRQGLVGRPDLCQRLTDRSDARLTLISAPPGFGKTTLLAEWLASKALGETAIAWLSLDSTDNQPAVFWAHVVAALTPAIGDMGQAVLPMLKSGQPIDIALAMLLNQLGASSKAVDLMLDDYHSTDHPDIQKGMAFLLEHLPSNVHVVISTRADPALPLPRLRARGQLLEIRSVDLRFTPTETSTYLNEIMGLGLTATDLTSLDSRTEGWIAAIQLAALSMRGRHDVSLFIQSFAGNDKYIVDYLVEEVLERLPQDARHFLQQTSFLSRLNGALCDAVTGKNDSKRVLEALDRANLFLVPLDDQRDWYRYHHLFADVLRNRFAQEVRPDLPNLHKLAAGWFEQNGERSEAISHALMGRHFEQAAILIEPEIPSMRRNRQETALAAWLRALPDELVSARPVLALGLIGALVAKGEFNGLEDRIQHVERRLAELTDTSFEPHTPRGQLQGIPSAIELYRAALAQVQGDKLGVIDHARRAFDLAPLDDNLGRAGAAGFLAIAHWTEGDLEAACRSWVECIKGLQQTGHITDWIGATTALASVCVARGELTQAALIYERALERAGYSPQLATDLHAGLSDVYRERGDLQAAREHLLNGQHADQLGSGYRWHISMSLLLQAEGDPENALILLNAASALYRNDFFPDVRPLAAVRARLRLASGDLTEANQWRIESGLTVDDDLGYLQEYDHITLARLLLAQRLNAKGSGDEYGALPFLNRLSEAAKAGGRTGSLVEISVLQALAFRAQNEMVKALALLEQALILAEPNSHIAIFVGEGETMEGLLKLAAKRGTVPAFARRLLRAFGPAPVRTKQVDADLIEPLSDRELEVLRLLRSDLDGPAIARELGISLNTMRTHSKRVYEKLEVNNRRSAVSKAEELDLLRVVR